MKDIDWKKPENSNEVRRPFVVKIEESIAKAFIKTVQDRGLFVRETMLKLMREFVLTYGEMKNESGQGTGKISSGDSGKAEPDRS